MALQNQFWDCRAETNLCQIFIRGGQVRRKSIIASLEVSGMLYKVIGQLKKEVWGIELLEIAPHVCLSLRAPCSGQHGCKIIFRFRIRASEVSPLFLLLCFASLLWVCKIAFGIAAPDESCAICTSQFLKMDAKCIFVAVAISMNFSDIQKNHLHLHARL